MAKCVCGVGRVCYRPTYLTNKEVHSHTHEGWLESNGFLTHSTSTLYCSEYCNYAPREAQLWQLHSHIYIIYNTDILLYMIQFKNTIQHWDGAYRRNPVRHAQNPSSEKQRSLFLFLFDCSSSSQDFKISMLVKTLIIQGSLRWNIRSPSSPLHFTAKGFTWLL